MNFLITFMQKYQPLTYTLFDAIKTDIRVARKLATV